MNLPPLPDIDPHDHPEPRSFKWTNLEIAWIKNLAYLYGEACAKHALQNVKVSIPTATMEHEFARHYDRGYAAGRKQALEEALMLVPGGDSCNPQHIADEIRSRIK